MRNKDSNSTPARKSHWLLRLVSCPVAQFYKLEAKMWRELYQQQRGGKAFDDLQKELAETRRKLYSANGKDDAHE
jgi:hypothetical protein